MQRQSQMALLDNLVVIIFSQCGYKYVCSKVMIYGNSSYDVICIG